MPEKIAVAMSGGVDSSLTAAVLLDGGYEVMGVTMRLWSDSPEEADSTVRAAQEAARTLGIEHRVVDLSSEFRCTVVQYFVDEYLAGRTPNPCVLCNRKIKFGVLWEHVAPMADVMATGHYVDLDWDARRRRYLLRRGRDADKDQSYVLYGLRQNQLAHLTFPLGKWTKDEVRKRAAELHLPAGDGGESQDICFLPGGDYRDFLRRYVPDELRPGPIADESGEVVGQHNGLPFYTIGQRRGLGISASRRLYVLHLDRERNAVVVGPRERLHSVGAVLCDTNFLPFSAPAGSVQVQVQIRYNAPPVPAVLCGRDDGDGAEIHFSRPQPAVTPGQSAVCYWDDLVVGGGVIHRPLHA